MAAKLARNSSLSTVDTDNLKEEIQGVSHNDLATIDEAYDAPRFAGVVINRHY
jgi:hypothetical protein